jgi:ATP-dependent DNA helicase DinG
VPAGVDVARPACVVLWASGTDTRLDGIVRMAAVRRSAEGGWESFETFCAPFADDAGATRRIVARFGVGSDALEAAPPMAEAWRRLREFVNDRPVLADDGTLLATWARALDRQAQVQEAPLDVIGLDDVTALVEPGHLSSFASPELIWTFLEAELAPQPKAAIQPPHVLAALAEVVARFQDHGPAVHAVCARGWRRALEGLEGEDLAASRRLARTLDVIEHPGRWGGDTEVFAGGRLRDGILSEGAAEDLDEDDPLAILDPAVARQPELDDDNKPLDADTEDAAPFMDEDLVLLDELFKTHLPDLFNEGQTRRSRAEMYRKSQHRVAEEVARCLGSDELLLVHAPTGTGKTLAYLLPALIWSRRYGVRVGIATYTRALQSQAMEREVPRALAALSRAGLPGGFKVSILKGREHSLCWRALRIHTPQEGDDPETWLAWTTLALFGLRDGEGDLDRFPRRPPVRLMGTGAYRTALRVLLSHVKGRSGCCSTQADRAVCAAETARRKAERSHVVITNHSFALARPEFFRRVVFDECEHLHDQAMSAWSHRVSFPDIRRILRRLHEPGARSGGGRQRPALDRLQKKFLPGSAAHDRLKAALVLWTHASTALSDLEAQVLAYEGWRSSALLGRGESEQHGLFREFVETCPDAGQMITARVALESSLARLDGALAQLTEELELAPIRRGERVRRTLELSRIDVVEVGRAVASWLPMDNGLPSFGNRVFHDVERNVRDEPVLAALVLLPGDALGRHYYPELSSAAFVSATTRLGGSFDKARRYLGLDRVAARDRETGDLDYTAGCERVTSFHAPEVFDYSRVMVGVPRGVPSVQNREAYLDFLARYLPWYAERTRGRMLVLFTSLRDVREVGERATAAFEARGLPLFWQGMDAAGKEELSSLFRERVESTLFGVDTFWYGADFPGDTLETLVLARLPYGVPDRYHHAQCAAIGRMAQHNGIYMPRALAKFRQGFGRLMRKATDRGVVLIMDSRVTERRHREFMGELPVERPGQFDAETRARLVRGDIDLVGREAFAHLGLLSDMERRGLAPHFSGRRAPDEGSFARAGRDAPLRAPIDEPTGPIEINPDDLPY